MSEDLVKRSDAIKEIKEYIVKENEIISEHLAMLPDDIAKYNSGLFTAIQAVYDVPSTEEWIPCSERLPDYREAVLVSTFWGVRMAERDSVKEDGTDDFWYLYLDDATARPMYVYAWMSLPEPWKGEESEE